MLAPYTTIYNMNEYHYLWLSNLEKVIRPRIDVEGLIVVPLYFGLQL
jgi:hypothetical protein